MTKIPTLSSGMIGHLEVGYLKKYSRNEDYFIDQIEQIENCINAEYFLDYLSSVWIINKETFERFANTYKVISGGWVGFNRTGENVGGRWRTSKRTYGEIEFHGILNLIKEAPTEQTKREFTITKPRFSKRINIRMSSPVIGIYIFDCENIVFSPSGEIALHDLAKNEFVDATDMLIENGLRLKE
jgi:hypothetical protein